MRARAQARVVVHDSPFLGYRHLRGRRAPRPKPVPRRGYVAAGQRFARRRYARTHGHARDGEPVQRYVSCDPGVTPKFSIASMLHHNAVKRLWAGGESNSEPAD